MEAQDILVGNLEGSITLATEGNPRKRFQFRMPPGTSAGLKAAGFDLVLLGNNHVLDFGPAGFSDTLADTEAAGLPTVGAGLTSAKALATRHLGIAGRSGAGVSFIGFASFPAERYGFTTEEAEAGPAKAGVNADVAATLKAIRTEAAKGSFVVVLAHGGSEYRFEPAPEIRARYRSFIDAGAGLVLGTHPHLLQGVEAWDGGIIAYSLGNFLFTGEREPEEALHSALLSFLVYRGRVRGFAPTAIEAGYAGSGLDESGGRATIEAFAARCASLALPLP
jgi:poly-gamma-glutamate synthesis protein (capsule biosynthesis protein)